MSALKRKNEEMKGKLGHVHELEEQNHHLVDECNKLKHECQEMVEHLREKDVPPLPLTPSTKSRKSPSKEKCSRNKYDHRKKSSTTATWTSSTSKS